MFGSCRAKASGRCSHDVRLRRTLIRARTSWCGPVGDDGNCCPRRDLKVTRFFFPKALKVGAGPVEATPTEPATYPPVLDELLPAARHDTARYSNYRIEGRSRPS
jgi:hypothetical protein